MTEKETAKVVPISEVAMLQQLIDKADAEIELLNQQVQLLQGIKKELINIRQRVGR